jgi:hypothetical protein
MLPTKYLRTGIAGERKKIELKAVGKLAMFSEIRESFGSSHGVCLLFLYL